MVRGQEGSSLMGDLVGCEAKAADKTLEVKEASP
jgi:hypothetical protein